VLNTLAAVVESRRAAVLLETQLKDPGDELVLAAAVNAGADRIATFNFTHLAVAAPRFEIQSGPSGGEPPMRVRALSPSGERV
jgi:hypothetical protein